MKVRVKMPSKSNWRDLPKTKKAAYLLEHITITDSAWTPEKRHSGESREAFIKRLLGRGSK